MAFPWLWLPFLFLSHILFASVQLCEIPGRNLQTIKALNSELLKLAGSVSQELNPSIYLGLRLSNDHDLEKEREYYNRLRGTFHRHQNQLGTGLLALYLLVMRAACHNMATDWENRMVTKLKLHLHREKKHIDNKEKNHPITNYYQYSLGILALCIHKKQIDLEVIRTLLSAEEHGTFNYHRMLSIDTEAMAGLAFICLEQDPKYSGLQSRFSKAVKQVKAKILGAQTPEGIYGNIYSSPLAVQFLSAAGMKHSVPALSRGMTALIQSLEQGDFQNTLIRSQLLPALYCKSYLDIASMTCQTPEENSVPDAALQKPQGINPTQNISVRLEAKNVSRLLYRHVLDVPLGSTLLNVLEAASNDVLKPLKYDTLKTLSGLMLIGVMEEKIKEGERKYWKILRHPNSRLDQGIAEYIPQNQEHIILKMSSW